MPEGAAPAQDATAQSAPAAPGCLASGDGYLRLLQIDEADGMLRVFSYSPFMQDFNFFDTPESQHEKYKDDPADEEYELPLPWLLKP